MTINTTNFATFTEWADELDSVYNRVENSAQLTVDNAGSFSGVDGGAQPNDLDQFQLFGKAPIS